jgi:PAS domain S-box-containing protein
MGVNLGRFLQGPSTDKNNIDQMKCDLDKGKDISLEILNYHKNGSEYWNNLLISTVKGSEGNITHFVDIQNDINEKKNKQSLL